MIENEYPLQLDKRWIFLINPILDFFTVTEKINFKAIYNPYLKKPIIVRKYLGTYPVYLPEVGYLLSLDVTSHRLVKKLYNETRDFESFYSDNKMICSSLYNFDKKTNRVVTWGNFRTKYVPDNYYKLYISNILNDFLITPSFIKNSSLISPNRWFKLESNTKYFFKANVNYNVGLMYINRDALITSKRIRVWLNNPLDLYEIKVGFIKLFNDGTVKYKSLRIHFIDEPTENKELLDVNDYFIAFLVSFNNYETNYYKYNYKNKFFNLNLVESLSPMVHSPYAVFPFIFPNLLTTINLNNLIFNFKITKNCFNTIIKRFMKFTTIQNVNLLEVYEQFFEQQNKLVRINKYADYFDIKLVNPSVIPFLLKKYIFYQDNNTTKLLNSQDLIESLELLDKNYVRSFMLIPLKGFGYIRKLRSLQFANYYKNMVTMHNYNTKTIS